MNYYFVSAGLLCFIIGLVHSVLGERLIFHRMRHPGQIIPRDGGDSLAVRQLGIVWASWHALSAFGFGFGVLMMAMGLGAWTPGDAEILTQTTAWSMAIGAALVLFGTAGRHPGWLGLGAVAALVWLGASAQ